MDTTRNRKRRAEMSVHEVECIERNGIVRPPISSSSHLPPEQDNSAPVTGTGNAHSKTWKEYVLLEGLIDNESIERVVKHFPLIPVTPKATKTISNTLYTYSKSLSLRNPVCKWLQISQ